MKPDDGSKLGTRFELGPVQLLDCDVAQAAHIVGAAVRDRQPLPVHLCNAFTLALASKDPSYARALSGDSLNLVDGTPVTWYFRILRRQSARGPVRGATLMRRLLDTPNLRHYLYGGSEDVLAKLREEIAANHPLAEVVDGQAPPFRDLTEADIARLAMDVERTRAQVVWVGLGTPKQDFVIYQLTQVSNCVAIGVGAAFDFLSGTKPEAPRFLHGTGLEWTHRLLSEPRRLWRRYLWGNIAFVQLALRSLRAKTSAGRRANSRARL